MKWYQLAENPQSLDNLYEIVPELKQVELFSIHLNRDGNQIQIRFDLPAFPDKPSTRWHKDDNTAQILLSFNGIQEFEGRGWQRNMKVRIDIKKRGEFLEIIIGAPEINLSYRFLSDFLTISSISPYQKELF